MTEKSLLPPGRVLKHFFGTETFNQGEKWFQSLERAMKRILTVLRHILDDSRSSQGAGQQLRGFLKQVKLDLLQ